MMNTAIVLDIHDLHVSVGDKPVLRGVELQIRAGEVHALMGPNGSGKTTLANVLAGRAECRVTAGQVLFFGRDLLAMAPEERAWAGLFLGFQNPVEIPGVSNTRLLKEAINARQRQLGLSELDAMTFRARVGPHARFLGLSDEWLQRPVNVGFSGGEKKRNELFQMMALQPRLAILDEIDSGLDIDALGLVAAGINALRDGERALLLVTHYPRLLEQVVPDRVQVLSGGRLVLSGGWELAKALETRGYGWVMEEAA